MRTVSCAVVSLARGCVSSTDSGRVSSTDSGCVAACPPRVARCKVYWAALWLWKPWKQCPLIQWIFVEPTDLRQPPLQGVLSCTMTVKTFEAMSTHTMNICRTNWSTTTSTARCIEQQYDCENHWSNVHSYNEHLWQVPLSMEMSHHVEQTMDGWSDGQPNNIMPSAS